MKSRIISHWVYALFGDLNRLAGLPLDLRRFIIMPMILSPFVIVAKFYSDFMVSKRECSIDGLFVGSVTTFNSSESLWIVGDGKDITLCGVHGPFAQIHDVGSLLMQEMPMAARRDGEYVHIVRPIGDEWDAGEYPEHIKKKIDADSKFDRVVYADEENSCWEFVLWDGGRELCRCWSIEEFEDEPSDDGDSDDDGIRYRPARPATIHVMPWVPVNVYSVSVSMMRAAAPWGEEFDIRLE